MNTVSFKINVSHSVPYFHTSVFDKTVFDADIVAAAME